MWIDVVVHTVTGEMPALINLDLVRMFAHKEGWLLLDLEGGGVVRIKDEDGVKFARVRAILGGELYTVWPR